MDAIKDFLRSICRPIGKALNLSTMTVGIIGLIVGVLVLALIITIIIVCVKKSKKKKAAKKITQTKNTLVTPKIETPAKPVVAEVKAEEPATKKVEEQPAVEEKVEEPAVEVKEEKAETPAPEVKEEKPIKKATPKKTAEKPAEKEVKPAVKPAPKTVAKEPAKKPATKKATGKWVIEIKKDNEYIAALLASNGEVMLTSEIYTTAEGAKNGIATIIKGVENGNFVIYNTKGGDYYFKLKSAGNKLLCAGEIYTTKDGCESAVESVKRFASTAVIVEEVVEGDKYVDYVPEQVNYEVKKGARGKWKVEQTENGYAARLYANNGQLMLSTEEVKEKKTAIKAIESVKKNSAEGNFIIDKDKFGRFYYKLRNSQKSVICIGEGYDTVDACISALESVRRFSAIATYQDA